MSLMNEFFDIVRSQVDKVQSTQGDAIQRAAALTAESIANGGIFYIYDRGHLLSQELLHRAGGPAFVRKMTFDLPNMRNGFGSNPPKCRADATDLKQYTEDFEDKCIEAIMVQNCMKAGDVLFYNSVSGSGRVTISVARTAKRLGIKLIVLTNKATNDRIGEHDESLKLYKYADVYMDNCVIDGDAAVTYEGCDERILPMSGISAAFVGWAYIAATIEELNARGIKPTVYRSVSSVGGPEQLQEAYKRYDELGY